MDDAKLESLEKVIKSMEQKYLNSLSSDKITKLLELVDSEEYKNKFMETTRALGAPDMNEEFEKVKINLKNMLNSELLIRNIETLGKE